MVEALQNSVDMFSTASVEQVFHFFIVGFGDIGLAASYFRMTTEGGGGKGPEGLGLFFNRGLPSFYRTLYECPWNIGYHTSYMKFELVTKEIGYIDDRK